MIYGRALADGHPVRGVLAGDDRMRAGAVEVHLADRAVRVVGPVQVAAVDRHPDGAVNAADDDMRAGLRGQDRACWLPR